MHGSLGELVHYEAEVFRHAGGDFGPIVGNEKVQLRLGRRVDEDRERDDLSPRFAD